MKVQIDKQTGIVKGIFEDYQPVETWDTDVDKIELRQLPNIEIAEGTHISELTEEKIKEKILAKIRTKRNELLQGTDFTQIPDAPLTSEQREAYRVYRQALRDLPENIDISNPLFPDKPE